MGATVLLLLVAPAAAVNATSSPGADSGSQQQSRLLTPRPVVDESQSLAVTAQFDPPRPGRQIRLQQKVDDGWRTIDSASQGRDPQVDFVLPPREPEIVALRAVAGATQDTRRQRTPVEIVRWASPHETVIPLPPEACCENTFYTDLDLSEDGRWVVQRLGAAPFQPSEDSPTTPLVLYDRLTRAAVRITPHDGTSPSISARGERIAYGAVPRYYRETPGVSDAYGLYIWDRSTATRTRLVRPTGYDDVGQIDLSADGRWVAFESEALEPDNGQPRKDPSERYDPERVNVFLMNVRTGQLRRLAGPDGPAYTSEPSINRDGTVVVYEGGDPPGPDGEPGNPLHKGPFLWERGEGSRQLFPPTNKASDLDLDLAGAHLAYAEHGPVDPKQDVFWRDLRTGESRLVMDGTPEGDEGFLTQGPVISGSGRFVSWVSSHGPDSDPSCAISCLRRWDSQTGATITVHEAESSDPTFLRTDRTGTLLAYAGFVSEEIDGSRVIANAGVDFAPW